MPDFPIRRTVRLIGAPTDINSSFLRGPALGPAAMRKALASDHANGTAEIGDAEACLAKAGDVWLYATPILHASERAAMPAQRRVVQVDYATVGLLGGLEWFGLNR